MIDITIDKPPLSPNSLMRSSDYNMFLSMKIMGMPKYTETREMYSPNILSCYNNSRVTELVYYICDKDENIVKCTKVLIIPDNFTSSSADISNMNKYMNFSDDITKYLSMEDTLRLLYMDLYNINTLVMYNVGFYINILLSECYRYYVHDLIALINCKDKSCTMELSTNYDENNNYMKPNELYNILFYNNLSENITTQCSAFICMKSYYSITRVDDSDIIYAQKKDRFNMGNIWDSIKHLG